MLLAAAIALTGTLASCSDHAVDQTPHQTTDPDAGEPEYGSDDFRENTTYFGDYTVEDMTAEGGLPSLAADGRSLVPQDYHWLIGEEVVEVVGDGQVQWAASFSSKIFSLDKAAIPTSVRWFSADDVDTQGAPIEKAEGGFEQCEFITSQMTDQGDGRCYYWKSENNTIEIYLPGSSSRYHGVQTTWTRARSSTGVVHEDDFYDASWFFVRS